MLTVWGRKTSSNVQALMWCIGELRLEYRRIDAGEHFGGTDSDAFVQMNPNRAIPVLRDGDGPPLWETGCILRYLATKYAGDSFWPRNIDARTKVDMWAEWSKLNVASLFTVPVFWRVVRTPENQRDQEAIRDAVAELEAKLMIANDRLETRPYLAGSSFSLADIQFGHVLYRYYDIGIERAELSALKRYFEQLKSRPAYAEHVMVSYEELRAR